MITAEDIAAFEQDILLEKVRPDIKRALHAAETAMHYLHETSDYESDALDNVCSDIQDAITVLKGFVNA